MLDERTERSEHYPEGSYMNHMKIAVPIVGAAVAGLLLAGCGGSSSSSSTAASPAASTAASSAASTASDTALADAKAALAPYTGQPNAFPVDQPLEKPLPAGSVIAFLESATPVCATLEPVFGGAVQALGAEFKPVKAVGTSAADLQQAMESIIAAKPSGVAICGAEPAQILPQLRTLKELGIPVVSAGGSKPSEDVGLYTINGPAAATTAGGLLADWTFVENGNSESVVYVTPELSFTTALADGYTARMTELCPDCVVRVVKVPISTIGNTAPSLVVNDLKSNPQTKTAIFGTAEASTGLPAALKVAGINVDINGYVPAPPNIADLKKGDVSAWLAPDLGTTIFQSVDLLARLIIGQELPPSEANDVLTMQMITAADLNDQNSANGIFTAYPDFAPRFMALWSAGS